MNTFYDKAVYVDWKSESENILFALREEYSEEDDLLSKRQFDELAQNYATKEPEVFLNALGQELTCFGYFLYELENEGDSYALTIVAMEKEKEFKAFLKEKQSKATKRKQAKLKIGEPAKRVKLGKKLPAKKITLEKEYAISLLIDCYENTLFMDNRWSTGRSKRRFWHSATLDLNEWPPKQETKLKFHVDEMAKSKSGKYVAMVNIYNEDSSEPEELAEPKTKILIGSELSKIEDWQCVYENRDLEWTKMTWFEEELFVADSNCVYHIKDVTNFAESIEKVLELKDSHFRWYPKFCVVGNQLFLYMHQDIYRWEKASGFVKIHKIDGFYISDFVAASDNKIVFQERPEYIIRGEKECELTVLDITTLEVVKYPSHYGYIGKWTKNRICVFPLEPTSKMPIIECYDFHTNEKKCLMYGALGRDVVTDIYETDCGTILQASSKEIYMTKYLWEFMETVEL